MKLIELKEQIDMTLRYNRHAGDAKVCIPIYSPGAVGGTPCVTVTSASLGFDWDTGKFILYPCPEVIKKMDINIK